MHVAGLFLLISEMRYANVSAGKQIASLLTVGFYTAQDTASTGIFDSGVVLHVTELTVIRPVSCVKGRIEADGITRQNSASISLLRVRRKWSLPVAH